MDWIKRVVCCVWVMLGAGHTAMAGELASAGFRVPVASVNAGGAVGMRSAAGADMFSRADATIGQASPAGLQRNAAGEVVAVAGLWTPEQEAPPTPRCLGDCNGDGTVTVDELIRGVNIALGSAEVSVCGVFDANADEAVTIDEVVKAVNNALNGCPTT
jgi:hypothetical protein